MFYHDVGILVKFEKDAGVVMVDWFQPESTAAWGTK